MVAGRGGARVLLPAPSSIVERSTPRGGPACPQPLHRKTPPEETDRTSRLFTPAVAYNKLLQNAYPGVMRQLVTADREWKYRLCTHTRTRCPGPRSVQGLVATFSQEVRGREGKDGKGDTVG
ncbi:hypothetical protein E2C01_078889 [Portunus trituberculatus]|uniref:Uncharacterized protein n=1 Tax=Portunus trituberculatus TaxID=210409 RepID=A0A5B7IFJ9_PORTR|nr:hypothetical protein [Portunus trituberculatus]